MGYTQGAAHLDEMRAAVQAEDWDHADRLARIASAEFLEDMALSLDLGVPAILAELQNLEMELSTELDRPARD